MLRTRAAALATLPVQSTGVVLPGVRCDVAAVVASVLNATRDDPSVVAAMRAMQRHQKGLNRIQQRPLPLASHDARHTAVPDLWLTLTIGIPERLDAALAALTLDTGRPPFVLDTNAATRLPAIQKPALFGVSLSDAGAAFTGAARVGVAALVIRPDMRTAHLVTAGPWSAQVAAADVQSTLQRVVREHLAQWLLVEDSSRT